MHACARGARNFSEGEDGAARSGQSAHFSLLCVCVLACARQSGPRASLYLTLVGILAGFLSTFWNFGYTRTAIKMQQFLDAGPGDNVPRVKKQNVRGEAA
jgi:hypothetical protein